MISDNTLQAYRALANETQFISAVGEYTPLEFTELLNYIDELKVELSKFQHGYFTCPDCGYNVSPEEFLTGGNVTEDEFDNE